MMGIYTLFIKIYVVLIRIAALFNPKAKKWIEGRRDWPQRYAAEFNKSAPVLWVHAASLGEFEQGRPVIEAWREQFPDWQIVLTFFSPSGYEIRKNYPQADFIAYLPADTPGNASGFIDLIKPDAAVFVKYEFWANYLLALKARNVPTVLVSALFRERQPFFQPWGGFWRRMLSCFNHIFVQNATSAALLRSIQVQALTVAGDTRVDRVLRLAAQAPENVVVAAFATEGPVLVAGSTWPADEAILVSGLDDWKLVIAPHEPSEKHLVQLEAALQAGGRSFLRYSQAEPANVGAVRTLIIDNVGMLNTLYRYGRVAYIGGGFGRGIHNTLEPAAYGLPVVFGPNYEKFEEARAFVGRGGGFSVGSLEDLQQVLAQLNEPVRRSAASQAVLDFLAENQGATDRVLAYFASGLRS